MRKAIESNSSLVSGRAGLLMLAMCLSGCSSITTFVFSNYSSDSITVTLQLGGPAEGGYCDGLPSHLGAPQVFPLEGMTSVLPFEALRLADDFRAENESCQVEVVVRAGEGLVLWTFSNYQDKRLENGSFPVEIVLSLDDSEIYRYDTTSVAEKMRKRSAGLYEFRYD